MLVKLTFPKIHDENEEELVYTFIECFIFSVDLLLYRTPDYLIEGTDRLSFYIYGLSIKEADTVYNLGARETGKYGIVKKVIKQESDLEEDIGNFEYAQPDFKEGAREKLEENKGFNKKLDIQKFVGTVIETTHKILFEEFYDENSKTPITDASCCIVEYIDRICESELDHDPKYKEWELARHIAYTPMEKNRKVRKPRAPRKPRAHRSENNRCFEYS